MTDTLSLEIARLLACPACGRETLCGIGNYEICDWCWWEDDGCSRHSPDFESGPNWMTLNEARAYIALTCLPLPVSTQDSWKVIEFLKRAGWYGSSERS